MCWLFAGRTTQWYQTRIKMVVWNLGWYGFGQETKLERRTQEGKLLWQWTWIHVWLQFGSDSRVSAPTPVVDGYLWNGYCMYNVVVGCLCRHGQRWWSVLVLIVTSEPWSCILRIQNAYVAQARAASFFFSVLEFSFRFLTLAFCEPQWWLGVDWRPSFGWCLCRRDIDVSFAQEWEKETTNASSQCSRFGRRRSDPRFSNQCRAQHDGHLENNTTGYWNH